MNATNHNNCDGCFSRPRDEDPYDIACAYASCNAKGQCPCTQCVVKVMCEEPCTDYSQFRKVPIIFRNAKDLRRLSEASNE